MLNRSCLVAMLLLAISMFCPTQSIDAATKTFSWSYSRIKGDGVTGNSFSQSISGIRHWIYLSNVSIGDVFEWKYYRPVLDSATSQPTGEYILYNNTLWTLTRVPGAWVFSSGNSYPGSSGEYASGNWSMGPAIFGYRAAGYLGPWRSEVYRNGVLLTTETFSLIDDIPPTVSFRPSHWGYGEGIEPIWTSVKDNFRIASIILTAQHLDTGETFLLQDYSDQLRAARYTATLKMFSWDITSYPPGEYLIKAQVEDAFGNSASQTKTIIVDADKDGDGFTVAVADGDCDDDPITGIDVFPGAEEICGDGKDNNCDGQIDENCCEIIITPNRYSYTLDYGSGSAVAIMQQLLKPPTNL